MLYAKFVNASVPHAKVVSIDTSAAEKYPGVRGVHVIQHVLGNAVLRNPALDPAKYPVVRYAGQPDSGGCRDDAVCRRRSGRAGESEVRHRCPSSSMRRRRASRMLRMFSPERRTKRAARAAAAARTAFPKPATFTDRPSTNTATPSRASKTPTSLSKATTSRRCRRTPRLETHGVVADWKPDMLTV